MPKLTKTTLIGLFFHSTVPGHEPGSRKVEWQGQVVSSPEPGFYLVQLFSWADGEPTNMTLVTTTQMVGWKFYTDTATWREAGDRVL